MKNKFDDLKKEIMKFSYTNLNISFEKDDDDRVKEVKVR